MAESDSDDCFMMVEDDSVDDASEVDFSSEDEENVIPKKKVKAAPIKVAPKKSKAPAKNTIAATEGVLGTMTNTSHSPSKKMAAPTKEKTVEERYQKKSQIEHILIRPDTYIGSTQPLTTNMYVLSEEGRIIEKEITYTPGLYKIFDEIVVNAADNKQRDPMMDKLDIVVDAAKNVISVRNNGKGIPVVMHKEHQVYVPTMIFGHLLTGSNFDDDEQKTTGGRNGYGAKLANVFSKEFIVDCVDVERGVKFHQVFRNNMSVAEEPVVRSCSAAERKAGDSVQITFSPDLERFKMDHLDEATVGLFARRAYDIAGTMAGSAGKRLQVTLNGQKLPIKSFKEYIGIFDNVTAPVAYAQSERWEVCVGASNDASMQQISFVNAIHTSNGGKHVMYIADQIAAHLTKALKKKSKGGSELKKAQIINHLFIMINCLIENPSFDSQSKDRLNSQPKTFGSKFELSPEFLKKIEKSDIAEKILSYATFKDREALKRKGGVKKIKLTGIAKLDDANFAGGARSTQCTLIICEGDSAKSLAMAGLSVVGRDFYGVFPLKGKPMNVRDAKTSAVNKNEEIENLVKIMGLKYGTKYDETNIKTLRYGHLMIMADQDSDGSHIKGLIVNLIHNFWPSLLDVPGFLQQFITPIVKVTKGKKSRQFFTLPEYEQWLESTGNNGKGYTIKYYKGLGTSTSAEAKEYFSNLDLHEVHFDLLSNDVVRKEEREHDVLAPVLPDNVHSGSDLIDMVFRKERVDDRKLWLSHVRKNVYVDFSKIAANGLRYSDFINKELILFSHYDNDRSIPHLVDGLKPSQRKVLYGCFKRKLYKNEIKVAQLVGYVAEHSAYHHGEASLQGTIVNMAQNFVGSNNINLLTPSGQFGTRRMGGSDAASARYIFTKLEPIARAIFHPDDDELLNYLNDDGSTIEPEFYVPVIPLALCNGAEGIGTGWSSKISNYSPRHIIANLRRKIAGDELVPIAPFYCGFTGLIEEEKKGKYVVYGKIERVDDTSVLITELPIKKWTQNYKEFLEGMLTGDGKTPPEIKDMKENHTETTVAFTVVADKEKIDEWEKDPKGGLYNKFKLTTSISTTNMTLFDEEARIVRYDTPEDIINTFYDIRLDFYIKRKANLVKNLESEKKMLSNKARFVEEVCAGRLVVNNRKRKDILEDLQTRGYDLNSKEEKKADPVADGDFEESLSEEEETSTGLLAKGYEYLLGMKIWSLTFEKAEQLRSQLDQKTKELELLLSTDPTTIWIRDLEAVEVALDERDAALQAAEINERKAQKKNKTHVANKKKVAAKKKKDDWDSGSDDDVDKMDTESESDGDFVTKAVKSKLAKPTIAVKKQICSAKPPTASVPFKKQAPVVKSSIAPLVPLSVPKVADVNSEIQGTSKNATIMLDDSSDDDLGESLMERMQKKLVVSPPPKPLQENNKKRPSPRMNDGGSTDSHVFFVDSDTQPKPTKAAKKPASKPKATARTSVAAKKTVGTKKTLNLKKVVDTESEEDFDFPLDDDDGAAMSKAKAPPARFRPARSAISKKPVIYALSSDDDSDAEFSE